MNYSKLFDAFLDAVFIIDDNEKIIYCNQAGANITGLSQKRILKKENFSEIIKFTAKNSKQHNIINSESYSEHIFHCPNQKKGSARVIKKILPETNHEIIIMHNTTLEVSLNSKYQAQIQKKQKIIDQLEIAQKKLEDYSKNLEKMVSEKTTQLKMAQKDLIQSSKLASLGVMVAGIAHEVNNPLTMILGPLQLLLNNFENSNCEQKTLNQIQNILKSATRIRDIVNDLKKFGRIEIINAQVTIHLIEVVKKSISKLKEKIDNLNIKTIISIIEDFPQIKGNFHLLEILIDNLINNSIDSFKELTIKREFVIEIALKVEDNSPVLEFIDNAAGMNENTGRSIFDPFFTTKDVGAGQGLGMSVSYGIINEHNANISVESAINEGTKIIIQFNQPQHSISE